MQYIKFHYQVWLYKFQYHLESFTEWRETCWMYTVFLPMSEVDGTEKGSAPLAWDIPVTPQDMFQAEVKTLSVPHTASVKHCFRCLGLGHVVCQECHAKGWVSVSCCYSRKSYFTLHELELGYSVAKYLFNILANV